MPSLTCYCPDPFGNPGVKPDTALFKASVAAFSDRVEKLGTTFMLTSSPRAIHTCSAPASMSYDQTTADKQDKPVGCRNRENRGQTCGTGINTLYSKFDVSHQNYESQSHSHKSHKTVSNM